MSQYARNNPEECRQQQIRKTINSNLSIQEDNDIKKCPECDEPFTKEEKPNDISCSVCKNLTPYCDVEYNKDIGLCPKCHKHV